MCLYCHIPGPEKLADLDSFDLAFLTLTGHIEWRDPLDACFLMAVKSGGHSSLDYLWGPEADLMSRVIRKAWQEQGKPLAEKIVDCFDTSGDITVDKERLKKALKDSEKIGKKMWLACGGKVRAVFDSTVERARAHFDAQKEQDLAETRKDDFEDYVAEAMSSHVQAFLTKYPGRILHPEIQRLVGHVETKVDARLIDRGALTERLNMVAQGETYFDLLSDVEVGRAWTFTGIQLAQRQQVTEYVIIAEMDRNTCPVCERLHGRHFPVSGVASRMETALNSTDVETITSLFPFPRESQLDNVSQETIRDMHLAPPFHGNCRCDVHFLWKESAVATSRQEAPEPPKVLPGIGGKIPGVVDLVELPAAEAGGKGGVMSFEFAGKRFFAQRMDETRFMQEAAAAQAYEAAGLGNYVNPVYAATGLLDGKPVELIASELLEGYSSLAQVELYKRAAALDLTPDRIKQRLVLQDWLIGARDRSASNIMLNPKTGAIKLIDYDRAFDRHNPEWWNHELMGYFGDEKIMLDGPKGFKYPLRSYSHGKENFKFDPREIRDTIDSADEIVKAIKKMKLPDEVKDQWSGWMLKRKAALEKSLESLPGKEMPKLVKFPDSVPSTDLSGLLSDHWDKTRRQLSVVEATWRGETNPLAGEVGDVFYTKVLGHSEEDYQYIKRLLHSHGSGGEIQLVADRELKALLLDKTSSKAKMLHDITETETRLLRAFYDGHVQRLDDAIKEILEEIEADRRMGILTEYLEEDMRSRIEVLEAKKKWPPKLYRRTKEGGDLPGEVESWTLSSEGAETSHTVQGGLRIAPNVERDIGELLDEGYQSIGGIGRMTGAPGENEVTLINLRAVAEVAELEVEITDELADLLETKFFRELFDTDMEDLRKHPLWSKATNPSHHDEILDEIAKLRKFDGTPELLNKKDFEAAEGLRLLRGVSKPEFADEFKKGKYFSGRGTSGDGTYTAYGKKADEVAKYHATSKGELIDMKLRPTAKVIKYDDLIKEREAFLGKYSGMDKADALYEEILGLPKTPEGKKRREVLYPQYKKLIREASTRQVKLKMVFDDAGRMATFLGYDAIDVPDVQYMIVLNRTAVVVSKERKLIATAVEAAEEIAEGAVILTANQKAAINYVRENAKKFNEKHWRGWAKEFGMTEKEWISLREAVKSDFGTDKMPLVVNRTMNEKTSFPALMKDGRIKNQFELGKKATSGGAVGPYKGSARDVWERILFGEDAFHADEGYKAVGTGKAFPADLARERPVYGYINDNKRPRIYGRYGGAACKVRKSALNRVTFGIADSDKISRVTSKWGRAEVFTPDQPDYMIYKWIQDRIDDLWPRYLYQGGDRSDESKAKFTRNIIKKMLKGDRMGFGRTEYIEVQFHGGIDFARDIEKIYIPRKGFEHVRKLAEKYNIPVEYYDEYDEWK
jgi:hypothetical protein